MASFFGDKLSLVSKLSLDNLVGLRKMRHK